MREAFLMSGVALAFYGLNRFHEGGVRRGMWLVAAGILLFAFSPLVALPVVAIMAGMWALSPTRKLSWRRAGLFTGALALGLVLVITILAQYPSLSRAPTWRVLIEWFQYNFGFQAHLLERSSGWVQKLFREAGGRWEALIVLVYGIARPVLPATLVEPAPWIWRLTNALRASGWYALAPLLIYGTTRVFRSDTGARRAQLIWLSASVWGWVVVSAFIGGGDQIDNPRYRTILIALEATLAAWAWWWARARRDAWLWRWLMIEAVFLLFFIEWYISRYTRLIPRLPFWVMVAAILGISAAILIGGWLRDRRSN
jgi:hypothetical protein